MLCYKKMSSHYLPAVRLNDFSSSRAVGFSTKTGPETVRIKDRPPGLARAANPHTVKGENP
jgi:hypothetical protein